MLDFVQINLLRYSVSSSNSRSSFWLMRFKAVTITLVIVPFVENLWNLAVLQLERKCTFVFCKEMITQLCNISGAAKKRFMPLFNLPTSAVVLRWLITIFQINLIRIYWLLFDPSASAERYSLFYLWTIHAVWGQLYTKNDILEQNGLYMYKQEIN